MLHALLHSKLKNSFENTTFNPSEDTLTSSAFGILQYLPDDILWKVIRKSCGEGYLPESIGKIEYIDFWSKYRDIDGTTNSYYVEPDVLLVTEKYYVVIEAKKYDGGGQYQTQWKNEIINQLSKNGEYYIIFDKFGRNI